MSPARATIMTLFQCRPLWLWHFWGAIICLVAISYTLSPEKGSAGAIFRILVVPLWSGVVAASLTKDFLSRPFSFGLPLHSKVWRKTLYLIGLSVAAVCAFLFLLAPAGTPEIMMQRAWLAFFLCMAMYVSGALAAMSLPNTGFLPAAVTLVLVIGLNDGVALEIRSSIERFLTASPIATTAVCAAIVAVAWRGLGSRATARKLCGEPFLPLHSSFSGERQRNYNTERKLRRMQRSYSTFVTSLERFFLAQMRTLTDHPTLRSFSGTLYIQMGNAAPARVSHFVALGLILTALSILLGFYKPGRGDVDISGANLVLFLLCIVTAEYRINPHATLLLNIGRRDRFRSMMFSAFSQWLVVAAVAAVITAVSIAAGRYLGEVTLYGLTYTYAPISPKTFLVFAPILPFFFLSQIIFPKYHLIVVMVIASSGTIVFMLSGYRLLEASWWSLLLMQAVCWLPFLVVARYQSYSLDLKLTGK